MVKLFIPVNVWRNMILITYRLGSWKKALGLNRRKLNTRPFIKRRCFRLGCMQMTVGTVRRRWRGGGPQGVGWDSSGFASRAEPLEAGRMLTLASRSLPPAIPSRGALWVPAAPRAQTASI